MSIPADLSKMSYDVFKEKMDGKTHVCTGGTWLYTDDLQSALDAVVENALRWAQDRIFYVSDIKARTDRLRR